MSGKKQKSKPSKVNKDTLTNLNNVIQQLRVAWPDQLTKPQTLPNDDSDLPGILNGLMEIMTCHSQLVLDNLKNPEKPAINTKMRSLEDENDETKQRSLKGNLIVSSISYDKVDSKPCLIKTIDQLNQDKTDLTTHAVDLVKEKFGVDLPKTDIQAVHHLPSALKKGQKRNEAFILRIWNRTPGSAWSQMTDKIKSGQSTDLNVYFNFQLTQRRASLLQHVRDLQKNKKISKFYSDENGRINIKVKDGQLKKQITFDAHSRSIEKRKTLLVSEVKDLLGDPAC